MLQPDLGTAVSLLVISATLLFVAGLDLRWVAVSVIFAVPAFYLLVFRVNYRRERILAFLNPWEEPLGRGFQIIQSLISVGIGRHRRARIHGRQAEALLSARSAHGFHFCRRRRRAGT